MFNNLSIALIPFQDCYVFQSGLVACPPAFRNKGRLMPVTFTWGSVEYRVAGENCHLCQE